MRGIKRNHGIETAPEAAGMFAALLVLLIALLAVQLGGCAHVSKLDVMFAQANDQYDRVVEIRVSCLQDDGQLVGWYGSGAIVDATHVLTAGHVAEHDANAQCAFTVEDSRGKTHLMRPVKVLDSEHVDLARMELISPAARFTVSPAHYGPRPKMGDYVCTVTGHPRLERKCGRVMKYKELPGDMRVDFVVEPGNSGSGLYDARGDLVGIVVHLYACSNGQYCSGAATSLEGKGIM